MTRTSGAFEHLGTAIRIARARKGWSQTELAERSGVTKAQVSNYERSQKSPSLESLEKVMAALEMNLFDLAEEIAEIESPEGAARARPAFRRWTQWAHELEGLPEAELQEAIEAILRFLVKLMRGDRGGDAP